MSDKEFLRKMLHNLINDKQAEAEVDLHNYLVGATREKIHGAPPATPEATPAVEPTPTATPETAPATQ